MTEAKKIKKSMVLELMRQNQIMRELLEDWPPREIMMDFEKEWDERRASFLNNNPAPAPDFKA